MLRLGDYVVLLRGPRMVTRHLCGDGEGVIPGVNRVGARAPRECNCESLAQGRIVGGRS